MNRLMVNYDLLRENAEPFRNRCHRWQLRHDFTMQNCSNTVLKGTQHSQQGKGRWPGAPCGVPLCNYLAWLSQQGGTELCSLSEALSAPEGCLKRRVESADSRARTRGVKHVAG